MSDFGKTKVFLKRYGYLPEVTFVELDTLDEESKVFKDALFKLQDFYGPNFIGEADQVLGPKTIKVVNEDRCACPDFYDDPEIPNAAGSGSWPTSCHETGIKVSIDTRNAPSFIDVDAIWQNAVIEYGKIGVKLVRVNVNESAHIRQSWRNLSGSTIGLAQFNSRSCSDSVFNYRDPSYRGNAHLQNILNLHEMGHNMNLQHTRGGIMHPSVNNTPDKWVEFDAVGNITYKDTSYNTLKRFFGGLPIPGTPSPDPDPDPTPDPTPKPEPNPMPPIPYDLILEIIGELIKFCQNRNALEGQLKEFGPVMQWRFARKARQKLNISRAEWRAGKGKEVMEYVRAQQAQMNDSDFSALAEELLDE